jgi:hypothetical protein
MREMNSNLALRRLSASNTKAALSSLTSHGTPVNEIALFIEHTFSSKSNYLE